MPAPLVVAGLAAGARMLAGAAIKQGAKGAVGATVRQGAAKGTTRGAAARQGAARGAAKSIRGGSTQGTRRSSANRFSSISRSAGKSASRAATTPSPGSGGASPRSESPSTKEYVAPNLRGTDTGAGGYHGGITTGNSGLRGRQDMFQAEAAVMQSPAVTADVMPQGKVNISTAATTTAWRKPSGKIPPSISKTVGLSSYIKFE